MLRGWLVAGALGLGVTTAGAQAVMPALEVESLSGETLQLPADLPPKPTLLIVGFSREAREQTEPWTRRMTATRGRAASVSVRQVIVLDAPKLLQGFIVDRLRGSVPRPMHERFLIERDNVDEWKQLAGYEAEDAAYLLLLDPQHRVIWRSVGAWSRETERDLLGQLAAIRATTPQEMNITRIDTRARELMQRESVAGLALAVIDGGRVTYIASYGHRNVEQTLPLTPDTVMYGASLTKAAFAYLMLQLVDEKRLDLDTSIAELLPRPLPEYEDFADLAGDERWRALTPRMLLSHVSGLSHFRWLEDDGKLRFHHDPGVRYGYSGEGFYILQLVLKEGLGLDVDAELQTRIFGRFGMKRTSMLWREDFAANLADGHAPNVAAQPHDERFGITAAVSINTTIADKARLWAAIVRGEGLSEAARAEIVRPQLAITSKHHFPTSSTEVDPRNETIGLAAGLGVVVFNDDSGPAFFKTGHNDSAGSIAVCLEAQRRCAVLLSNDVSAERIYPELVAEILGETRMPWHWEYNWIETDAADAPDVGTPVEDDPS